MYRGTFANQGGGGDACVPGIEKLVNSKKFSADSWKFGFKNMYVGL